MLLSTMSAPKLLVASMATVRPEGRRVQVTVRRRHRRREELWRRHVRGRRRPRLRRRQEQGNGFLGLDLIQGGAVV